MGVDAAISEEDEGAAHARPQGLEHLPRALDGQRDVGAAVHAVLRVGNFGGKGREAAYEL